MPTTRRFRCSHPATARPGPAGCGRMCATIGQQVTQPRRRFGLRTHRTARENILAVILKIQGRPAGRRVCGPAPHLWRWDCLRSLLLGSRETQLHDIHVVHASPTTTEALARIGALYGIEEEIRGKPAELRRSVRQARAKPLLDDLRHWMEKTLRLLSTKSETAGAIRYALSRWRP